MQMPSSPTTPTLAPLAPLAQRCLVQLDELVDAFITRIENIQPYGDERFVSLNEVRIAAAASYELLIRLVGGLPIPDRLTTVAERIGRDRSRQGVPLPSLLQAVRVDVQVLWEQFLRLVADDERELLLVGASAVWEAVEGFAIQIQAAYLDEEAVAAREQENKLGQLLRQLLATAGRDEQVVAHVRTALRAQADGAWLVARCRYQDAMLLESSATRCREMGLPAHAQEIDGWPLLVVQLHAGRNQAPERWLKPVLCGISMAQTLEEVAAAADVALSIAKVLRDGEHGPKRVRDVWPDLVVERLAELREPFAMDILRNLRSVPQLERDRLVETAQAYCRLGSVAATSAALYCHRNTVLNRLHRLEHLTGFDITSPWQAAPVLLGLKCVKGPDGLSGDLH